MWQDYVFFIVQLILALALLPSIYSKDKPNIKSSVLMTGCLMVMTLTNITLGLWLGALGAFVNVIMWLVLAIQKYKRH